MKLYLETIVDGERIRRLLTEDYIKEVLTAYVDTPKETLNSFQYVGGIHHVGLYVDEDTPFFEGVMIYLKQKEKPFQKTFKNGK